MAGAAPRAARTSPAAAANARLKVLYATAVGLCVMMVAWVVVTPGSCTASTSTVPPMGEADGRHPNDEAVAAAIARYVPVTLVTKYHAHPEVCAAHVLPSVMWSVLAPTQLHPRLRRACPRAHRICGRMLIAVAGLMTGGYAIIHRRGLHFHANDFPSLARGEALSALAPGLWERLGGGGRAGAIAAFIAFEHCAAGWFAGTAAMTLISAVRRQPRRLLAHRAWAVRHVAAGLSVAMQRVLIFVAHGACAGAAWLLPGHAARTCTTPEVQKGIFADALVLGTALCLGAAELAVCDMRHVWGATAAVKRE